MVFGMGMALAGGKASPVVWPADMEGEDREGYPEKATMDWGAPEEDLPPVRPPGSSRDDERMPSILKTGGNRDNSRNSSRNNSRNNLGGVPGVPHNRPDPLAPAGVRPGRSRDHFETISPKGSRDMHVVSFSHHKHRERGASISPGPSPRASTRNRGTKSMQVERKESFFAPYPGAPGYGPLFGDEPSLHGRPASRGASFARPKIEKGLKDEDLLVKKMGMAWKNRSVTTRRISLSDAKQLKWSEEACDDALGDALGDGLTITALEVPDARTDMMAQEGEDPLKRQRKFYLLNPRSPAIKTWDLWIGVLLMFVCIFTPYEVAFLEANVGARFWLNRVIDIFFILDILLQFFLPYQHAGTGQWVFSHYSILRHYARTWLIIDVVSVVPVDVLTILYESDEETGVDKLRSVRLVRLLRLAKLLRVLRAARLMKRWEASLAINYARVSLVKFAGFTVLVCHWLACAWYLVIVLEGNEGCSASPDKCDVLEDRLNWVNNYQYLGVDAGPFPKYIAALYWSIATLSTLGYGDVVPTTDGERIFVVVAMVTGASTYSYMIGSACSIILGMNEKNQQFYQTIDSLNTYMEDKGIPRPLRSKLRDFFRFRRHNVLPVDASSLLRQMSPMLRSQVSLHVHSRWITAVPFFRMCDEEFVNAVVLQLTTEAFSEGELVVRPQMPALKMYIVEKGVIHVGESATLATYGSAFGVDMIFRRGNYRRMYSCHTLSNAVVHVLGKPQLFKIIEDFPEHKRRLRKYVLHQIFRNNIMLYKDAIHRLQVLEGEGWVADLETEFHPNILPLAFQVGCNCPLGASLSHRRALRGIRRALRGISQKGSSWHFARRDRGTHRTDALP
mmetsp:Transcript_17623/g.57001  ORF Transcript_17623/g.57001 Transcript_17623/m.57001 type:complete len:846 (-) Transcript_17623:56-2593(-)